MIRYPYSRYGNDARDCPARRIDICCHGARPGLGGQFKYNRQKKEVGYADSVIYMVVIIVFVIDAGLNAAIDILRASPLSKEIPVKSFVQVLKLVLYGLAAIAVLSLVLGRSPVLLFSGLGAMTAVLMLVFKDPLLGFIAGIQLSANRMVARGDWIEMPKYGADGDVLEVALTTVKIQNWDKTITTIPTYALITESFKNWHGMTKSDARRIKRAINIDMQSIKFCDNDMLARFVKIQHVSEYMDRKREEIAAWNAERGVDASTPVNGRRLTNVGTFRAYVVAYLNSHPMIDVNMTFLLRQLAPTPHGLPIEYTSLAATKSGPGMKTFSRIFSTIYSRLHPSLICASIKHRREATFRRSADTSSFPQWFRRQTCRGASELITLPTIVRT